MSLLFVVLPEIGVVIIDEDDEDDEDDDDDADGNLHAERDTTG